MKNQASASHSCAPFKRTWRVDIVMKSLQSGLRIVHDILTRFNNRSAFVGRGLLGSESLKEADGFLDVLVQANLLMDDFALRVQNRNDV